MDRYRNRSNLAAVGMLAALVLAGIAAWLTFAAAVVVLL